MSSKLPRVYIDRVTLESASDADVSGVRSSVSIYIREEIERPSTFKWISNPILSKNLKIILIRSTDENSTALLTAVANLGENLSIAGLDGCTEQEISITEAGLNSVQDFQGYVMSNAEKYDPAERAYREGFLEEYSSASLSSPAERAYREGSLIEISAGSTPSPRPLTPGDKGSQWYGRTESEMDSGTAGEYHKDRKFPSVAKIYFKKEDIINEARPKHLTYFAFTRTGLISGSVSIDTPLEHGRPSSKSVQDFRQIEKINRLRWSESSTDANSPGLSIIEKQMYSTGNKFKNLKNYSMIPSKKDVYFSDIMLSRDRQNQCAYGFFLDYHSLVRDSSLYKNLYNSITPEVSKTILDNSRILSFTVKRRRINSNATRRNKLGAVVMHEVFDTNTSPTSVVTAGYPNINVPFDSSSSGSIGELQKVIGGTEGLRFFTGVDKNISSTKGLYQYGVEIRFDDYIMEHLKTKLSQVISAKQKIDNYYIEATKLGMRRFFLEVDPHINHAWEKSKELSDSTSNYNSTYDRFTKKFINEQKSLSIDKKPWERPIDKYFELIALLTPMSKDSPTKEIIKSMVHPETASPRSILAVMGLFKSVISRLYHLIGFSEYSSSDSSPELKSTSKLPTKSTTMMHWFENDEFDSDLLKNHGYDFLSIGEQKYLQFDNNGFRSVNYVMRMKKEYEKYISIFPEENLYDWSFLSPHSCILGDSFTFSSYPSTDRASIYSLLASNILLYNSRDYGKQMTHISSEGTITNRYNALREFYSNMDVLDTGGTDWWSFEKGFGGAANEVLLFFMKTFSKTGLGSDPSNKNPYESYGKQYMLGDNTLYDTQNITIDFYGTDGKIHEFLDDAKLANSIMSACGYHEGDVEDRFLRLPMQIRTLSAPSENTYDSWSEDPINPIVDKSLSSYFNFKYSMINRVDVLSGFKGTGSTSSGKPVIKAPIWKPLTKSIWESSQKGQLFICRMTPFDCPEIGIEQLKGLKLPVYDTYFILESNPQGTAGGGTSSTGSGY